MCILVSKRFVLRKFLDKLYASQKGRAHPSKEACSHYSFQPP